MGLSRLYAAWKRNFVSLRMEALHLVSVSHRKRSRSLRPNSQQRAVRLSPFRLSSTMSREHTPFLRSSNGSFSMTNASNQSIDGANGHGAPVYIFSDRKTIAPRPLH